MQTSFSSLGVGVLDSLEEVAAGSVDMKSIAAAAEEDEELADVAEVSPALVEASVLSGASVVLASSIFRVRRRLRCAGTGCVGCGAAARPAEALKEVRTMALKSGEAFEAPTRRARRARG